MKFTLSWLKDHLATDADIDALTQALTRIGLEVEELHTPAAGLAGMVVGRVTACDQHPNADKLKRCTVEAGGGQYDVVCGAPNARTGMLGVFAPPGTWIPGLGDYVGAAKVRGVQSQGMLLSEHEVGLSEDHSAIIDLTERATVGQDAASALGLDEPVIELGLTPNRPDCAGVYGIARDLAAAGMGRLKPLAAEPVPATAGRTRGITIAEEARAACPLFIGRELRGVQNGESPAWLQNRLKQIGLRPISALVDITNYVTFDLARPSHAFDADKVQGDLYVRLSRAGEQLDALDGYTYTLPEGCTVICDDRGPQGLGGVIGGAATAVDENTQNILLEVATFDPTRTAKTGRALGLMTDARYRFERGVDPAFLPAATEILSGLVTRVCGGEAAAATTAGAEPAWQRPITLRANRPETLGGLAMPWPEQHQILHALGFDVGNAGGETVTVTPPPWRPDVAGEADVVEELLRIRGYDAVPATSMTRPTGTTGAAITPAQRRPFKARRALAGRGLLEAVTWSFVGDVAGEQVGFADATLRLSNPISQDLTVMRPSVLPNLLQAAQRNADRGFPDAHLCEVGPVYVSAHPDGQLTAAAAARTGRTHRRHWAEAPRDVDVFDAKADALAVLASCGVDTGQLQVRRDAPSWYHPGRSGTLQLGDTVLAQFGEIHPATLKALDVSGPAAASEVFLERIPAGSGTRTGAVTLSAFQPVRRDFAFLVDDGTPAEALVAAARSADPLVEAVSVFDVYQGKGIPEGQKSLALEVRLQPYERTLTDSDLEAAGQAIISAVQNRTGARLRG